MRLLYEFELHGGHVDLHDDLVHTMYLRQLGMYQAILKGGNDSGAFDVRDDVDVVAVDLVTLEDAYGLHIVAGNSLITVDSAQTAMFAFCAQAGCRVADYPRRALGPPRVCLRCASRRCAPAARRVPASRPPSRSASASRPPRT